MSSSNKGTSVSANNRQSAGPNNAPQGGNAPQGKINAPSGRRVRNQQRAARWRSGLASGQAGNVNVPLPVPVTITGPMNGPKRDVFRLPRGQMWVKIAAQSFSAKPTTSNDAIQLSSLIGLCSQITDEVKIFRLIFGFIAKSDGHFALVEEAGDNIPSLPVVGRVSFAEGVYRSREIHFAGLTSSDLSELKLVWDLKDDNSRKAAGRIETSDYWIAISRPNDVYPPGDILRNSD
uniref:Coat protein n=1 Tax=Apple ilarvirus 1 TaxID=2709741 RepID=A0A6C0X198_9BROM|nr:MAG: coat protein [Apple ilarvirus 1]